MPIPAIRVPSRSSSRMPPIFRHAWGASALPRCRRSFGHFRNTGYPAALSPSASRAPTARDAAPDANTPCSGSRSAAYRFPGGDIQCLRNCPRPELCVCATTLPHSGNSPNAVSACARSRLEVEAPARYSGTGAPAALPSSQGTSPDGGPRGTPGASGDSARRAEENGAAISRPAESFQP